MEKTDLTKIGYGENSSKFAYLFMTDEDEYVDGTWEADGGENAIILQPGENKVKTENLEKGPSLYNMVKKLFKKRLVSQDFECAVKLNKKKEDVDYENAGSWTLVRRFFLFDTISGIENYDANKFGKYQKT